MMPRHGVTHPGHIRARRPDWVTDDDIAEWLGLIVASLVDAGFQTTIVVDMENGGSRILTEAPDEAFCVATRAVFDQFHVPYMVVNP